MLLKIYDREKIDEVQDKFNECFPYLKLEFFSRPHKWAEGSSAEDMVRAGTLLEDIRRNHLSGLLDIKSWDKTGKVEQSFRDMFGLNVQIFRLHKNRWVQTTDSDDLTLKEQSELAKQSIGPSDSYRTVNNI